MSRLRRLVVEVHRRSLWQVLLIYVGAAWACFELIDAVTERLGLPAWLPGLAIVLFLLALPVVLATAFVREVSPPAVIRREAEPQIVEAEAGAARHEARRRQRLLTVRNAGLTFLAALVVWGIVAVGWLLYQTRASEEIVEAGGIDPDRIAVFPFTYSGSEEFDYMANAVASLLSATLDGAGNLRSVDPRAVLGVYTQERGEAAGLERARVSAARLGAGRYVVGDVVEAGGRLRVSASLYGTERGVETATTVTIDDEAKVFELIDDLGRDLLVGGAAGSAVRLTRIAAATTDSLAALKAFLEGEAQLRRGRGGSALQAFQRATEIDSTFALAWYRLALAAAWGLRWNLAREAAELAVGHADRLSTRDRRVLEGYRAEMRGAAGESERIFREILAGYPGDTEALFGLGLVLYHYNPFRGRSVGEAREPLDRLLRLDPENGPAGAFRAFTALYTGTASELDSLIHGMYPGGNVPLSWRASLAFATSDRALQSVAISELQDAGPATVHQVVMAAALRGDVRGARDVARLLVDPARPDEFQALGHVTLANLELAAGGCAAAQSELAALEVVNPAWGLEYWAYLAAMPFVAAERRELVELREELVDWNAGDVRQSVDPYWFISVHNGVHSHLRLYLLGLLSVRLGENEDALRYANELEALAAPAAAGTLARDLALGVRAHIAWNRGLPEETLATLEAAPGEVRFERAWASAFYARVHEHFLRAEALNAVGRQEEALGWYNSIAELGIYGSIYLAPSHQRIAEILDGSGDGARAASHYRRFIELWEDADPELQPWVEAARRAIVALSPDT